MSQKHLIRCSCGVEHAVLLQNAGETLQCTCGEEIPIPTLRELRELPLAPDCEAPSRGVTWTLSHGLVFVTTLPVILFCLAIIARSAYYQMRLPKERPTLQDVLRSHPDPLIRAEVDAMTPWQTVKEVWQPYESISRLTRYPPLHLQVEQANRDLRSQTRWASIVAGIAAFFLLGSLIVGRGRA